MNKLVEHHTKYKEIHGEDETVWLSRSEHQKLHRRLRKTGVCNVSSQQLKEISMRAYRRTQKGVNYAKEFSKRYSKNVKKLFFIEKMANRIYLVEEIKVNLKTGVVGVYSHFRFGQKQKTYTSRIKRIVFTETIGKNARLFEEILCNGNTDSVCVSSFFVPSNRKYFKEFDEYEE